ncbi:MAG: tyrosine-type recombinase/integrase [Candidatus Binatia bacterium]
MSLSPNFPTLLYDFFHHWLLEQRNASRHTVLAYRDSWRLFLRFVADRKKRPIQALSWADLTAATVLEFLHHVEHHRGASVMTRNCRLAALRSFFAFVAERDPSALAQCAEVLRIPTKRGPQRTLCYLESDEVAAILAQPDRTNALGQRDHALLAFLYNTGARIQEALDVCPRAMRLESPAHVRLLGKGRKERICPLWPETVHLLEALLRYHPRAPDQPIFVNRDARPITAAGVRFRLRQYVRAAAQQVPSLKAKRVSPHTFRHTAAVHLIAAGVDVTVIRSWLGHAQLDTTNHYAQANLDTKRAALNQLDSRSRPGKPPPWQRDDRLLGWLESL